MHQRIAPYPTFGIFTFGVITTPAFSATITTFVKTESSGSSSTARIHIAPVQNFAHADQCSQPLTEDRSCRAEQRFFSNSWTTKMSHMEGLVKKHFVDVCGHPDFCSDDAVIPIIPWQCILHKVVAALLFVAQNGSRVIASMAHLVLIF